MQKIGSPRFSPRRRFVSIADCQRELGGISRSTFYDRVLPQLELIAADREIAATVRVGRRRMISRRVLDLFIELILKAESWYIFWLFATWHLFTKLKGWPHVG